MPANTTAKTSDGNKKELADRIRALRETLTVKSQASLAHELHVARTQVVAWEKEDSEAQPSTQNLVKLAELANNFEDRAFFLGRAGVDLPKLMKELEWEQKSRQQKADPGPTVAIPLVKRFRRKPLGPSLVNASTLEISSWLVPDSTKTIAVPIGRSSTHLGLPSPLTLGDLVLVDQSFKRVEDFLRVSLGEELLAAVMVPCLPEYLDRPTPKEDYREMAQLAADEPFWAEWSSPTVLYGYFEIRHAGGDTYLAKQEVGMRHQLVLGIRHGRIIELSDWSADSAAVHSSDISCGPILKGAIILGAVVGWIAGPTRSKRRATRKSDFVAFQNGAEERKLTS